MVRAPTLRGSSNRSGRRRGEGTNAHARVSSPILIGRQRQLRLLVEGAAAPPAFILVEGEAGVGKTRLVHEAIAHPPLRDRRVLLGNCHRLREPFLLGPVVEALRRAGRQLPTRPLNPVAGALQALLPELADVLPPEPPAVGDARAHRHRVFRGLRELLGAFGPTVCVLEDLHWADEGTLEFLAFLASQPPATLSLVVTYRSEEIAPSSPLAGLASCLPRDTFEAEIALSPLSLEETQELTCALLQNSAVSNDLARQLHGLTAGIPLALEELVRLLRDNRHLDLCDRWHTTDALHEVDVPPVVRQSVAERMERFAADARLTARAAAVLSIPASEDLIAAVAGLSRTRAAKGITAALSGLVLQETRAGLYGFRHALAAQAVYDDIPGPERRRLHLRAAGALESASEPRPLAQLAHHFREGERPRQWARYAEAAADAARAIGDDRAAARLLEDGLSAPGLSHAAKIRMAIKLGPAALYSIDPAAAIAPLQRILDEEAVGGAVRGELRYWISRLRCQTGDAGAWRPEMVRAAEELRKRPDLAARAMINLAWPVYGEGKVGEDLRWLDRAVTAVAQTDDSATKISVYTQRAAILMSVGDPAGWSAISDIPSQAGSVEEKLELLRGYHSLSVAALGAGHHEYAHAFLDQVGYLDDELDHVSWAPWRESTQISLDWRLGRWNGLQERVDQLSERARGRLGLATANRLVLSWLLLAQNRLEEAEQSFSSVLELADARNWMTSRITTRAGLGTVWLARDEFQTASDVIAPGLDVIRQKAVWAWGRELVPVAVRALCALGRVADARGLAKEFAEGIKGRDLPGAQGASFFCQGEIALAEGRGGTAARRFASAERVWSQLPSPYEAAKAQEARACCLLSDSSDESTTELLVSAHVSFQALGAVNDMKRTGAALEAEGVRPPSKSRGGRRAYGDMLSPREAEVAELAGAGKKNREIAETLFISQRTVETHVASALRKLGAETRGDLADALNEKQEAGRRVARVS